MRQRHRSLRRALLIAAALSITSFTAPSVAGAIPSERPPPNCRVAVIGMQPDGELLTTAPVCSWDKPSQSPGVDLAASSTIAVHYSGPNFQGSTFTVTGSGCNGGWLNFPPPWIDVISSTSSSCAVTHFNYFYLTGDSETTYGNANLFLLNNRTNSARYS